METYKALLRRCALDLVVVTPINRAVDDKAAKSPLGESFKRQLKYDETYSRITFISSKRVGIPGKNSHLLSIFKRMSWNENLSLDS